MNSQLVVRLSKVASEKSLIDAQKYLVCRHVFIWNRKSGAADIRAWTERYSLQRPNCVKCCFGK